MAWLWYTVLIIGFFHNVVAVERDCSSLVKLKSCDECIRCGNYWCNDPTEEHRCQRDWPDNWCPGHVNQLKTWEEKEVAGEAFSVKYKESSIRIGSYDEFEIQYTTKIKEPKVTLNVNSTQSFDFEIDNTTKCENNDCTTKVNSKPGVNFCANDGSPEEFYHVKLSVDGLKEEAVMKIHVPCACSCSSKAEVNSTSCNGRGTSVCGVCTCNEGWTGKSCEKPHCVKEDRRGDTPCRGEGADKDCWGNGRCGACDKCECFTENEGSRYYDSYCADLCILTNDCEDCFLKPNGECLKYQQNPSGRCNFALNKLPFNETALYQRDNLNRTMWVKCSVTVHELYIEYIVMKDESGKAFFMVPESKNEEQIGAVSVTLSIVLGVLGVLAAAAAVAGYMVWKNRTPPVPFTDPMYQNIDAEDCTGENPLYKPPTSSFKNPTYGKW